MGRQPELDSGSAKILRLSQFRLVRVMPRRGAKIPRWNGLRMRTKLRLGRRLLNAIQLLERILPYQRSGRAIVGPHNQIKNMSDGVAERPDELPTE